MYEYGQYLKDYKEENFYFRLMELWMIFNIVVTAQQQKNVI